MNFIEVDITRGLESIYHEGVGIHLPRGGWNLIDRFNPATHPRKCKHLDLYAQRLQVTGVRFVDMAVIDDHQRLNAISYLLNERYLYIDIQFICIWYVSLDAWVVPAQITYCCNTQVAYFCNLYVTYMCLRVMAFDYSFDICKLLQSFDLYTQKKTFSKCYPNSFDFFTCCIGQTDPPTTLGPPTTTPECNSRHTKVEHCYSFYCYNNQWQRFEFTATEECCKSEYHPRCKSRVLVF